MDIVVTKIGRFNDRDKQDIEACIKSFKLSEDRIQERGNLALAAGEELYKANLSLALRMNFD